MRVLNGALEIESEVGKGTTVILRFPAERTLLKNTEMSA